MCINFGIEIFISFYDISKNVENSGSYHDRKKLCARGLHSFSQPKNAGKFVFLAFTLELLDPFGPDFDRIKREI